MKLIEFNRLIEDQKKNELRPSKRTLLKTDKQLHDRLTLTNNIIKLMEAQSKYDLAHVVGYLEDGMEKEYNMTGNGTLENPYKIKTEYAEGSFCNAGLYFKGKGYPTFVKPFSCHDNSYNFATKLRGSCYVMSGIAQRESSFLHTVIIVENKVLDFNYNLLMDASLYTELFNFELISLTSSRDMQSYLPLINENAELLNGNKITFGHINFCFEDLIKRLKSKSDNLGF